MKVILNQTLIDQEAATISMQSEAVMFGFGAFETLNIKAGSIAFFAEHFERLVHTCKTLHLNFQESQENCLNNAQQLIAANQQQDGVLKINVVKHQDKAITLITTAPPRYSPHIYQTGFKLGLAQHRIHSRGPLVGLKHNNYIANLMGLQQARASGYDEALVLNEHDHIVEGCVSNLFFIKDEKIFTPCRSTGLLDGIYRQQVIHAAHHLKLPLEQGRYTGNDLESADEIFVTNSLLEIMPVSVYLDKPLDMKSATVAPTLMRHLLVSSIGL